MVDDMTLENYISNREKELKKIEREIGLLKKIDFPVRFVVSEVRGFELFSDNYSLSTDFKIGKRSQHLDGSFGYNGRFCTDRIETYPQFYFNIEHRGLIKPVYIKHEGFDSDSRIVVRSIVRRSGRKDGFLESDLQEEYVDIDKVFAFFKEQGVNKELLTNLNERIIYAREF